MGLDKVSGYKFLRDPYMYICDVFFNTSPEILLCFAHIVASTATREQIHSANSVPVHKVIDG